MQKIRLIPTILLQNGQIVKSIGFSKYQIIGNPKIAIQFFNAWAVDEIVFLDISEKKEYKELMRNDYNYKTLENFAEIVKECAKICFVPLTAGGGITKIEDMAVLFKNGVDKVCINTYAVKTPKLITEAAKVYGSQAVLVSMDVKKDGEGKFRVYVSHGKEKTDYDPVRWAKEAEKLGAGELYVTSIDHDGMLNGYDLELVKKVTSAVKIPVIASGGVGKWQDLVDGIRIGGASAVSAANIFHFTEQSTKYAKKYMADTGIDVRI